MKRMTPEGFMTPEQWKQERIEKFENWTEPQLKKWREIALDWRCYMDYPVYRCVKCDQCLYAIYDSNGEQYIYTEDECLAMMIAHIRQVHEEEVKQWENQTSSNSGDSSPD